MDINFREIQYHNSIGHILANPIQSVIVHRLTKYYKLSLDRAFSKYFKSTGPDDLIALQKDRHFVYFNVNAPMTLLFLTVFNGTNFCFYVTQTKNGGGEIEVVSVKHRFHDSLFEGDTVFEGKLVTDDHGICHYLINDIVVYQRHTFSTDLRLKLQTIAKILETQFIDDPILDVACISLQDFVDYQYLESFVGDHLGSLPYRKHINGLIFRSIVDGGASNKVLNITGLNLPANGNIRPRIWNNEGGGELRTGSSVCFKLKKTKLPDIYELYLTDSNGLGHDVYHDIAGIPDLKTSRAVKKMFINGFHYITAVCKWDNTFSRWTPILRSSRKIPDMAIRKN